MNFQRSARHVCKGQVEQNRQKKLGKVVVGLLGCYLDTPVCLAPEPAQLLSRGEEGEGAFAETS